MQKTIEFRDRAVAIALDSMRALYNYAEADLLSKDSAIRGKEILLGVLGGA